MKCGEISGRAGARRCWLLAIFGVGILARGAIAEVACGGVDQPCAVEAGIYYVALPENPKMAPVVLWLHGGSGANAIANEAFAARYTERGFALITPSGQPDLGDPSKLEWGVRDGLDWPRDDVAFLGAVLADAIPRFGLDGERILAAGFSRGGSMVWDLACLAPESATAFAAVAGGFWEPMATSCAGPADLHHTHGFADKLVPLEGREVTFLGYDYVQGNLFKGLEIWRRANGCPGPANIRDVETTPLRLAWTDCEAGSLTLQLTTGGHGIPEGWTETVLDWFAER